jgi:hypothetical protein
MRDFTAEFLGVPTLDADPARQLLTVLQPVVPYGTIPRGHPMPGTFHFYTADQKFTRLFARPERILATGCAGCIEPNPTTGPGVPLAAALFGIWRKRAAAKFWQTCGIRIAVDLNVDDSVLPYALLGVPAGWQSYAVRKHRHHGLDWLIARHDLAVAHAGRPDITFIVVGGGAAVGAACAERGWTQVPEHCRFLRLKGQAA